MNIKDKLRKVKKTPLGLLAWNELRRYKGEFKVKKYSDKEFIDNLYLKTTGRNVDWKNPTRFTEKLQWLKLFYRDPIIEKCSDKFAVREYVKETGYEYLLNDLLGVYDKFDDINFDELPDKFVLKISHGSGWNIVCKDKKAIDWESYRPIVNSWMKQNLYHYGREWNYNKLTPKIVIERYIDNGDGQLTDYKFFCFNGKPEYIQIDRDRFEDHKQTYYDMQWNKLAVETGKLTENVDCPEMFEEMKKIATALCKPFPHVRVDFYNVGKDIYFGEFTFFDGSGFYNFDPDEWDFTWGSKLTLPEPNNNLDLYNEINK